MNPRTPVALKENPHSCIGTVRWAENGRVYVEDMSRVFFSDEVVEYRPASIQERILEWHVKTFGPNETFDMEKLWKKFREESEEFLDAETMTWKRREAADVVICLYAYMGRLGFSLDEAVKEKFAEVEYRVDQLERDRVRGIS